MRRAVRNIPYAIDNVRVARPGRKDRGDARLAHGGRVVRRDHRTADDDRNIETAPRKLIEQARHKRQIFP